MSNYVLAFECAGRADDVSNTSVRFREAATQKAKAQPIRLHAKSLVSAKIDLCRRFVNYNPAAFREIFVCTGLDPCNVYLKLMFCFNRAEVNGTVRFGAEPHCLYF